VLLNLATRQPNSFVTPIKTSFASVPNDQYLVANDTRASLRITALGTHSVGSSTPTRPSTSTPPSTTGGSSSSIGPLQACVNVTSSGSTAVENLVILDPGAAGLKGTASFVGQGINVTDPFVISTTGQTAVPVVVSQPGTGTFTVSVDVPPSLGTAQHLVTTYTLSRIATTLTGCTPH
jgi:hypothetical protein